MNARHIGRGLSNREIAEELHLSLNTVKTYVRSAYRKIGAERRTQAVIWWVHHADDSLPTRLDASAVGL